MELIAALDDRQSLDETSEELNGWTPIHYACFLKSRKFLSEAFSKDFDPWKEDLNGRRAIDVARSVGFLTAQQELLKKMYGVDAGPGSPKPS